MAIITRAAGTDTGELLRREPLVWCAPEAEHPEWSSPLPLVLFPERDCRARPLILAAFAGAGRTRPRSTRAARFRPCRLR